MTPPLGEWENQPKTCRRDRHKHADQKAESPARTGAQQDSVDNSSNLYLAMMTMLVMEEITTRFTSLPNVNPLPWPGITAVKTPSAPSRTSPSSRDVGSSTPPWTWSTTTSWSPRSSPGPRESRPASSPSTPASCSSKQKSHLICRRKRRKK